MKRLWCILALLVAFVTAQADIDYPIAFSQLPTKAQGFVTKYFPNEKVAFSKVEKEWLVNCYCVIFTNGDMVEFDKNGQWTKVNCKYHEVPSSIVPTPIRSYIKDKYPQRRIVKIEIDTKQYDVFLDNSKHIIFNRKFQVTKS